MCNTMSKYAMLYQNMQCYVKYAMLCQNGKVMSKCAMLSQRFKILCQEVQLCVKISMLYRNTHLDIETRNNTYLDIQIFKTHIYLEIYKIYIYYVCTQTWTQYCHDLEVEIQLYVIIEYNVITYIFYYFNPK